MRIKEAILYISKKTTESANQISTSLKSVLNKIESK